jgi:hypothetical protein
MNKLQKQFEASCKRSFQFLIDEYGCQIVQSGQHAAGSAITYTNSTTAVKVSLEPRENFIFVYLIKLQNGKIPAYFDAPDGWVYLDAVLALKNPQLKVQQKAFGDWLKPKDIDTILAQYAHALRIYGWEVLAGDFTLFKTIRQHLMSASVSGGAELPLTPHNQPSQFKTGAW